MIGISAGIGGLGSPESIGGNPIRKSSHGREMDGKLRAFASPSIGPLLY